MIKIIRVNINGRYVFKKNITDNHGKEVSSVVIDMPVIQHADATKFIYFVPYDNEMQVIVPLYNYLNHYLRYSCFNTRRSIAGKIRMFYLFCELYNYKAHEMNISKIAEYISFLRDESIDVGTTHNSTYKSNKTINMYLGALRGYFSYAGISCDMLFDSHTVSNIAMYQDGSRTVEKRDKYTMNLKVVTNVEAEAPKYISLEQFKMVLEYYKDDSTVSLIVLLMWMYGMRIGEVLNLTLEDMVIGKEDGKTNYRLVVRNRLSSNPRNQASKGRLHPVDKSMYKSSDYKRSARNIIITKKTYDLLFSYINDIHMRMLDEKPETYISSLADKVTSNTSIDENHYVFLNRFGRKVNRRTLEQSVRKCFIACDIGVDVDKKNLGLLHRFRHGFAMYNKYDAPIKMDNMQLQRAMGHRSLSSTAVYDNPTIEMIADERQRFEEQLYKDEKIKELIKW